MLWNKKGDDDGEPGLCQPFLADGDSCGKRGLLLLGRDARDLQVQTRRSRIQLGCAVGPRHPPSQPLPEPPIMVWDISRSGLDIELMGQGAAKHS